MSQRGIDFANEWVSENIVAEGYGPEDGPDPVADKAVASLLSAASAEGISREEIEEDMGNLADFIAQAIEEANDGEVERLAGRDN